MPLGNPIRKQNESRVVSVLATEGQTVFTVQGGYIINQLSVFRNGVRLSNAEDFTAGDGSTVTLNNEANVDDRIEFHIFDRFTVNNAIVGAASSQTISGDLVVNGKVFGNLDVPQINVASGIVTTHDLNVTGVGTFVDVNTRNITGVAATFSGDVSTSGALFSTSALSVTGTEGVSATLNLVADQGDDSGDAWKFISNQDNNDLTISNNTTGSYVDKFTLLKTGELTLTNSVTATTFVGALTGNVTGNISGGTVAGSTGTFTGDVSIADKIIHTGDTDTKLTFTTDNISLVTGGTTRVNITSAGNLEMPNDNDYIKIGAGGDLSLVHNGSTSYVQNATGFLEFQSDGHRFSLQDGTEKARFDTSGRLLIGSTDGATYSEDWSDDLIVGSTANGKNDGITILSGTSQNGSLAFADSGGASRGLVGYVHNGDYLRFHAGNTLKARIDTDGLKFNSDTAAANALSDYEEGTFTPTNSIGMTLTNNQTARYTKIGRMVYIQLDISFSGANDSSQCGLIQSLPFTSDSSSGNNTHGALQYVSEGTNSGNTVKQDFDNENMLLQIQPNESRIDIITLTNGVRKTRAFLHGRRFRISMWYPAAT